MTISPTDIHPAFIAGLDKRKQRAMIGYELTLLNIKAMQLAREHSLLDTRIQELANELAKLHPILVAYFNPAPRIG